MLPITYILNYKHIKMIYFFYYLLFMIHFVYNAQNLLVSLKSIMGRDYSRVPPTWHADVQTAPLYPTSAPIYQKHLQDNPPGAA